MVIWPKNVNRGDGDWKKVCMLLQVLALDPRMGERWDGRARQWTSSYFHNADDYLIQPMIYVDQKRVAAPYYSYSVRFAVSCSFHGAIPVDSASELEEFRGAVNAALCSPITLAERRRWETNDDYLKACRSRNDADKEHYDAKRSEYGLIADTSYNTMRRKLEEMRKDDGVVRCSLVTHEEVLEHLIVLRGSMQEMICAALPT